MLHAKKSNIIRTGKRNLDLEETHLSVVMEKEEQGELEEKRRHQFAMLLSNPEHSVKERRNKRNHVSYGMEYTASDHTINIELDC